MGTTPLSLHTRYTVCQIESCSPTVARTANIDGSPLAGQRAFNMNAYQKRFVALEVLYLGAAYHGFASQADTDCTVEVIAASSVGPAADPDWVLAWCEL